VNDDGQKRFRRKWGCLVLIVGVFVLVSIFDSLGDKRPVGAFAENLVTLAIIFISPFACFFAAFLLKEKIQDVTGKPRLAFIIGVITFCILMLAVTWVGKKTPGVNWRLKKMFDEMPGNP